MIHVRHVYEAYQRNIKIVYAAILELTRANRAGIEETKTGYMPGFFGKKAYFLTSRSIFCSTFRTLSRLVATHNGISAFPVCVPIRISSAPAEPGKSAL